MLTFSPARLELVPMDAGGLPPASPPLEMSISAIPTGAMESRAAFAFRGGTFNDIRQFSMTALLVRHPRGDLLIDTGFGKNVDAHVKMLPAVMQKLTTYTKGVPAAEQLAANGISPGDLAGVVLTHAHWDHVGGLDEMDGVPVMVDRAEMTFIGEKTHNTELLNSFPNINYKQYDFEGGPYLGFPRSHDVWGDGSIVIVPAPGHTPGSVVVFIALPSGARYALLGDLVWQSEGVELPCERPWPLRRLIGEDDDAVRENIARIVAVHKKYPQIHLLPAHDASAFRMLPVLPAAGR
jgi:glyoxylase-like metal-dependent hydrolase (beta-lactamase superfamily II)